MDSTVYRILFTAKSLAEMSERAGETALLDEAIALDHEGLAFCHHDHPIHRALSIRIASFKSLLPDQAIVYEREAVALRPPGDEDRSLSLSNLALDLFGALGKIEDMEECIALLRESLALRPPRHPDHPKSLANLGFHLSSRYSQLGELCDLVEAISLNRAALILCPPGHTD